MAYGYTIFQTQGGWFGAVFSPRGLYALTLPRDTKNQVNDLLDLDRFSGISYIDPIGMLREELDRYFSGDKVVFRTPVDWSGYTVFQRQVLEYTAAIPQGRVVTYGDIARAIGRARACRAVGQALHINRTPIVVPCHRVLAHGGKLGGFADGAASKRKLLDLEGIAYRV